MRCYLNTEFCINECLDSGWHRTESDDAESVISSPIAPIYLGSTITAPLMPTKLFGVGRRWRLWCTIDKGGEARRYCFADRMTSENSLSNCYFGADGRGGNKRYCTRSNTRPTVHKCLRRWVHSTCAAIYLCLGLPNASLG